MTKKEQKAAARKAAARKKLSMRMFASYEDAFVCAETLTREDPTTPIDMEVMWNTHAMLRKYCHTLDDESDG